MTAEQLSMVAGSVLSLLFSYIPGLSGWYDGRAGEVKALIMAAAIIIVAAVVFFLSCYGIFSWVECTQSGAIGLVSMVIMALIANQSTYLITRKVG